MRRHREVMRNGGFCFNGTLTAEDVEALEAAGLAPNGIESKADADAAVARLIRWIVTRHAADRE